MSACGGREIDSPKPRGYYRITLPEKKYTTFDTLCPFSFEYPLYAVIEKDTDFNTQPYWYNIQFHSFKATLHLSYFHLKGDLMKHLEDSRNLAYKHTVKADAIDENIVTNVKKNIYGITYTIKGDAASGYQFILTDSVNHFLRGALYFNVAPNKDSIGPVMEFVKKDIEHLIETFKWK